MPEADWGSTTTGPIFDPAAEMAKYATAIERALKGLEVRLLLEPGRFLIAQAGALLARVLYVKRKGSKTFVITDAGMNDLIRPALYQAYHEILPVVPDPKAQAGGGRCCGAGLRTGDFFARDRTMPDGEGRGSGGNSRYRRLWHVAELKLQFQAPSGGGSGRREAQPG